MAYKLELPPELEAVHPVFHVSMLEKFLRNPSCITHVEDIQVKEDLSYEEVSMVILDRQICKLQTQEMASTKVLWRNNSKEEMTWEAEEDMKSRYPHLYHTTGGNREATMMG